MDEVSPRSYAIWAIQRKKEGFLGMSKGRKSAITKKMKKLEKEGKISEIFFQAFTEA